MEPIQSPRYRAVLIGIDNYPRKPLAGCVNDIDQIERILLDRLGVPPLRITRFAAPRPGTSKTRLDTLKPTRDGLRNFLYWLAEGVGPNDFVFLYYSGHGSQVMTQTNGGRMAREALVPVDFWNDADPRRQRLLYDYELNGLLDRIAEKAGDLTVVLDCCRSASTARESLLPGPPDRFLPISEIQDLSHETRSGLIAQHPPGLLPASTSHTMVAACRTGERAYETAPSGSKPRQGAFSRALVQTLESAERPLSGLLWSDVWTALLGRIAHCSSRQHPQLVGDGKRHLFGGPWLQAESYASTSFQQGQEIRV